MGATASQANLVTTVEAITPALHPSWPTGFSRIYGASSIDDIQQSPRAPRSFTLLPSTNVEPGSFLGGTNPYDTLIDSTELVVVYPDLAPAAEITSIHGPICTDRDAILRSITMPANLDNENTGLIRRWVTSASVVFGVNIYALLVMSVSFEYRP